ncbi:hypothetical protein HELRODRAFT_126387, partial [Helobdella robusta]|uniref:Signal recognition particle 19 kDa protein n=1 Tax=Helobdella robusta TaxID=6412 RepID=T1EH97_HELRO
ATSANALRPWNPNYNHADRERWLCIYPVYLNGKKTVAEGRRVPKTKAVDNPTASEIRDVLSALGLPIMMEDKVHPRERDRNAKGRVRVQLKNENNVPLNPQFTNKYGVLEHVCQMIPKLKTRTQNPSSLISQPTQAGQSNSATGGGKKNKGKR